MALKVFMMGGHRCGKTSVLAGLFEQIVNGPAKDYLTIADASGYDNEYSYYLRNKKNELIDILETYKDNNKTFLFDTSPSCCFNHYTLRIQAPGTRRGFEIDFCDTIGTFFDESNITHYEEIKDLIQKSDIFVITIDTPYLMGSIDESTKDICPDHINQIVNNVQGFHNLLTHIDDNNGKDSKMVVFVPMKCEKWAKEPNGLDKVTTRIKDVFAAHIRYLATFSKMNISIIPMQTSGNIIFSEFRKGYIYNNKKESVRCCIIDDNIIRKDNGEYVFLSEGDTVSEDVGSYLKGTYISKPYSWYHINPNDNTYSPKNCDQLIFHILQFIIRSYNEADKRRWPILHILPPSSKCQKWLDTMDIEVLKNIVHKMQENGIIINDRDGIEVVKNF